MKNLNLKNLAVLVLVFALLLMTTACGAGQTVSDASSDTQPSQAANGTSGPAAEPQSFRIGICNYVDDASLNQIVENIQARLEEISAEKGVQFVIDYDNCNADATVMEQIIANFQSSGADLLVGVATPVAMRMQTATEDSQTPVVFAAVSDPIGAGLVESLDAPGSNVTGTSDYLDTAAVMKLIFAADPDASKIGLLYDADRIPRRLPLPAPRPIWTRTGSNTLNTPAARRTKSCWLRRPWLPTALTLYLPRPTTPS